MTTPERLRRRQRVEGIALLVLAIAVSASVWWTDRKDDEQGQCIASTIGDLTDTLDARGAISKREAKAARLEAKATRLESKANSEFYRSAFSAAALPDVFKAYGQYQAQMVTVRDQRQRVDNRRAKIAQDRAANPFPAFPEGTCD